MSDDAGAHADPAWRDREKLRIYADDLEDLAAELVRAHRWQEQQLIGLDKTRKRIRELERELMEHKPGDPSPTQEAAREGTRNSDSDHRDSRASGDGQ